MAPRLLFESGSPGEWFLLAARAKRARRRFQRFPARDIPGFPELGELEVLRHFTRLSQRNFALKRQFYPLVPVP
jgi:glycine dehydrogenase subunit 2